LIIDKETIFFEGKINGEITLLPRGESGFGYDPIFVPDGYQLSFAQLSEEEKNQISHRAIAINKLIVFLQNSSEKITQFYNRFL
jgi:XTP/dITP diphosphohydrolase